MKTFSIIIPNTDSLLIGKIIEALRNQTIDLAQGEVIIVGSDNPGLLHAEKGVRFIRTEPDAGFASDRRNLGMQVAQGEVFLFLDDDCIPYPDWLERHLERQELGVQVVGGAVAFARRNYLQLADNLSAFHDLLPFTAAGLREYLSTANLSVHRSVVAETGAMVEHQNRAEDLEWTARFRAQGYPLYFDPGAIVVHDPPRCTFTSVWQHWIKDAPSTVRVRLNYARLLNTPGLAWCRSAYIWGAPLIAAWATARTFAHVRILAKYFHTLPMVYLTKLAWCWSAYWNFPPEGR